MRATTVVLPALFVVVPALAQAPAADKLLIYVDEISAPDKALALDAQALTTSLCAALAKDKRLDVLCAPDVKQILTFAATSAMIGSTGGPAAALEQRMERVKHVVHGTFKKEGTSFVLVLRAGPRSDSSTSTGVFTEKSVVAFEERGDKQQKLLDRLPAAAQKLAGGLLAPPASAPPAPVK